MERRLAKLQTILLQALFALIGFVAVVFLMANATITNPDSTRLTLNQSLSWTAAGLAFIAIGLFLVGLYDFGPEIVKTIIVEKVDKRLYELIKKLNNILVKK